MASETLKIIIAVICIGFLIYFLSMVYISKTNSQKKIDAENALDRMDNIISSLKVGNSERQSVGNPKGWHIYSFLSTDKPNSCAGESCLCICSKALDVGGVFNRQIKKCDEDGVCLGIRGLKSPGIDIKIMGDNSLVFLEVEKTSQGIFISQVK